MRLVHREPETQRVNARKPQEDSVRVRSLRPVTPLVVNRKTPEEHLLSLHKLAESVLGEHLGEANVLQRHYYVEPNEKGFSIVDAHPSTWNKHQSPLRLADVIVKTVKTKDGYKFTHYIDPYEHPDGHGASIANKLREAMAATGSTVESEPSVLQSMQEKLDRIRPYARIPLVKGRAFKSLRTFAEEANGSLLGELLRDRKNLSLLNSMPPTEEVFTKALVHSLGSQDSEVVSAAYEKISNWLVRPPKHSSLLASVITHYGLNHPDEQVREHSVNLIRQAFEEGHGTELKMGKRNEQALNLMGEVITAIGTNTKAGYAAATKVLDSCCVPNNSGWFQSMLELRSSSEGKPGESALRYSRMLGRLGMTTGHTGANVGDIPHLKAVLEGLADAGYVESAAHIGQLVAKYSPDPQDINYAATHLARLGPRVITKISHGPNQAWQYHHNLALLFGLVLSHSPAFTEAYLQSHDNLIGKEVGAILPNLEGKEAQAFLTRALPKVIRTELGYALKNAPGEVFPVIDQHLNYLLQTHAAHPRLRDNLSERMLSVLTGLSFASSSPATVVDKETAEKLIKKSSAIADKIQNTNLETQMYTPRAAMLALGRFAPEAAAKEFLGILGNRGDTSLADHATGATLLKILEDVEGTKDLAVRDQLGWFLQYFKHENAGAFNTSLESGSPLVVESVADNLNLIYSNAQDRSHPLPNEELVESSLNSLKRMIGGLDLAASNFNGEDLSRGKAARSIVRFLSNTDKSTRRQVEQLFPGETGKANLRRLYAFPNQVA